MTATKSTRRLVLDALSNIGIAVGFMASAFVHSTHWMLYFGLICLMTVVKAGSDHIVAEPQMARRAASATVTHINPARGRREAGGVPMSAARIAMLTPAVCDALIVGAVSEALDEFERRMNGLVYNGAGDPEQEFYDRGVAPWLEHEMARVRRTLQDAA